MDRRLSRLFAGLIIGFAIGLALLEGVPSVQDSSARALMPHGESDPLTVEQSPESQHEAATHLAVGSLAPDFSLQDLEGNNVSLSSYLGKNVLLNFWATWCGPCRVEMPMFERTYEKYRDQGFIILAINFDEPKQTVNEFQDEFGLTFPILLDPAAEVQQLYRIPGYPSSIFVDRDGNILKIHIGIMTESQLETYLDEVGFGT